MGLNFGSNLFTAGGKFLEDTPEDGNIQYWDGSRWVYSDPNNITVIQGTLELYQSITPSGDATAPSRANDGSDELPVSHELNEYIQFDYPTAVRLRRWRMNFDGVTGNGDGNGRFKIQYYSLTTGLYTDWVTDIAVEDHTGWTTLSTETAITTTSLKIVCTFADTDNGYSQYSEFEVYY